MAVAHSKINLCFLRKGNRDLQTCRSIEIPAMGGFMIHERNAEISDLLQEDREAVYFSDHEVLEKVTHWLSNDRGRRCIASQGLRPLARVIFVMRIGLCPYSMLSDRIERAFIGEALSARRGGILTYTRNLLSSLAERGSTLLSLCQMNSRMTKWKM